MSKAVRFLIKISLFLISAGLLYIGCDALTWGFTTTRLRTPIDLGFSNQGNFAPYFQQKYRLVDQGGQSYVFLSQDENTILKFFKDMPRPWLPWPSYKKKKLGKLKRTLLAYQLAYDHLRFETGLIAIHFKPSQESIPITLIDRLQIEHKMDLSHTYFVIQKRAKMAPFTADQLQKLLDKRNAAGITDHDPRFNKNIGWVGEQLIILDPGRFVKK